ncbi:alpha/beta hydrolase [Niastella sp. OAS944]|uniref:alpha/beta hydrolase n=1 Tax=Niastella sp. OAS944 TaxID=2664089 RepID=UPI00347A13F4|nr:phospholipase/carboxylesterase [Chitinophagaceae bacterium OAS944]
MITENNTTTVSTVLQYLVRAPKVQAEKKKAIILLHGVGSNEKDLFGIANLLPDDLYVISPRGQFVLGGDRYAWYQVDFSTGKPVYNAAQEASSRKLISTFIDQMKAKYQLLEVYVGGFSQGAIMSYSIGLTNPTAVKGILALSGRILEEVKPLVTKNDELKQLNVFIAHGVHDNVLPVDRAREAEKYLSAFGMPLTYHEYELGHTISEKVIQDINIWLAN